MSLCVLLFVFSVLYVLLSFLFLFNLLKYLCSFLLSIFQFPVLFSPCLFLQLFLISLFIFLSNLLSFLCSYSVTFFHMFYYYSIYSLYVVIHFSRALYLMHICYLSCPCLTVFLILLIFGKNPIVLAVLSFVTPFTLFLFPLFPFCSILCFLISSYFYFLFFCALLSSCLYATPVLTVNFYLYILNPCFTIYLHLLIWFFLSTLFSL